jgi:hypothetical protein
MDERVRPRRRRSVRLERSGEVYELVSVTGLHLAVLNDTAVALWRICDGSTELREMIDAVCALFGIEHDVARAEVERTIEDLAAMEVLRLEPPTPMQG